MQAEIFKSQLKILQLLSFQIKLEYTSVKPIPPILLRLRTLMYFHALVTNMTMKIDFGRGARDALFNWGMFQFENKRKKNHKFYDFFMVFHHENEIWANFHGHIRNQRVKLHKYVYVVSTK